ncbi:ExbD/TolR family protein [Pseudothauera rhizosphaerae]|uniref:Biopolymer transporter ExbD n=1 Tax=Pseudothauera rhizosphaerae TaxID=2565932 RepID=A0A4S4ATE3_9RHOO|nr:biopolymer transporter ExbD [Pseudothauera rhizosphaerae]THF62734.1 biopolymer transporter ExbD [Pseudothauera rhizosphaerae]
MGMNLQSPSPAGEPEVMIDINTTPLIDVMLVLLIMLIVTIPIQLHSVDLNLPQGNPPPPVVEPEVVRINIEGNGVIHWNGEALEGLAALESRLASAAGQATQPELHIRPDRAVPYQRVAAVMAAVQRNGLTRIGLVGAEQFL